MTAFVVIAFIKRALKIYKVKSTAYAKKPIQIYHRVFFTRIPLAVSHPYVAHLIILEDKLEQRPKFLLTKFFLQCLSYMYVVRVRRRWRRYQLQAASSDGFWNKSRMESSDNKSFYSWQPPWHYSLHKCARVTTHGLQKNPHGVTKTRTDSLVFHF